MSEEVELGACDVVQENVDSALIDQLPLDIDDTPSLSNDAPSTSKTNTSKKKWAIILGSATLVALVVGIFAGVGILSTRDSVQSAALTTDGYADIPTTSSDDTDDDDEEDCVEEIPFLSKSSKSSKSKASKSSLDVVPVLTGFEPNGKYSNDGSFLWAEDNTFMSLPSDENIRRKLLKNSNNDGKLRSGLRLERRTLSSTGIHRNNDGKANIRATLSGMYIVSISESNGVSSLTSYIELDDGIMYELINLPDDTGGLISGRSYVAIPEIAVISYSNETIDMKGELPTEQLAALRLLEESSNVEKVLGYRTVLVVRVQANNAQFDIDPSVVSDKIFGGGGDKYNLKAGIEACSFDKLRIFKAVSRRNEESGVEIEGGVVTVSVDANVTDSTKPLALVNSASSVLNTEFGVQNANELADHVVYCLPDEVQLKNSAPAAADIGGWKSWYDGPEACFSPSIMMHELSHNWRLEHANEGCKYNSDGNLLNTGNPDDCERKDDTGTMGTSVKKDEGPKRCFNAMNSWLLGWYEDNTLSIGVSEDTCFRGRMFGIQRAFRRNALVVVEINSGEASNNYYILFNSHRKGGMNGGTGMDHEVLIVRSVLRTTGANAGGYYSELVAKLDRYETWLVQMKGKNVTVTVGEIFTESDDFSSPVDVSIEVGDNACVGLTQSPSQVFTPAPTSKSGKSKATKCRKGKAGKPEVTPSPTEIPTFSPTVTEIPTLTATPTQSPTISIPPSNSSPPTTETAFPTYTATDQSKDDKCTSDSKVCRACRKCAKKPGNKCRGKNPEKFCQDKGCELEEC